MSEKRKREFVLRESLLTELFQSNKDMRSAFNLCFSIFVLLFATNISYYLIDNNEFYSDLLWLKWVFGANILQALILGWLKMQFSAIVILYPIVKIWLWFRAKQNPIIIYSHNSLLTSISVCYQSFLFLFAFNFIKNNDLSPVCSFALLCEQVRLSMKIHSFVEENRKREILVSKDTVTPTAPTLSQFLYFLYAPTLLYRDSYVRNDRIHWKLVFWYFLQVLAVIFCTFAISWRFVEHNFKETGIKSFEIKQLVYLLLSSSLVGMQMKLLMFYGLLHCWLNAFAEMMRFGDRQFYSDWWNCTGFVSFYRKWNIVVHEWLKVYIFDTTVNVTQQKGMAALIVFLVSAVIHEYLLAVSFSFFLPVLFCSFFIVGVLLFFVGKLKIKVSQNKKLKNGFKHKSNESLDTKPQNQTSLNFGNMFMFFGLNLGWGLMVMLYSMESYSRINCPSNDKSVVNLLLPRLLSCVQIL